MICVVEVISGPAKGKRIWIRNNERLQIGRHSDAELSIPSDPHLSRHHLLIEGDGGLFRARDLGSANGTFLNRVRISVVELLDGDLLRVGSTILSLSLIPDNQNPHAQDGLRFGTGSRSVTRVQEEEFPPTRHLDLFERLERECSDQASEHRSSGIHTPA